MTYDKPIVIQAQDPVTEEWSDELILYAGVNKTTGGTTFQAGADAFTMRLTFEVRYCKALEDLAYGVVISEGSRRTVIKKSRRLRIIYRERTFRVVDYDDYMEKHHIVRLAGELYE